MIVGSLLSAFANASTAKAFFPSIYLAESSIAIAIEISLLPPPNNTLLFYMVLTITQRAS